MKAGDVNCPLAVLVPRPGWLMATTGACWECGRAVGFGGRFCPCPGCAGRQQPSAQGFPFVKAASAPSWRPEQGSYSWSHGQTSGLASLAPLPLSWGLAPALLCLGRLGVGSTLSASHGQTSEVFLASVLVLSDAGGASSASQGQTSATLAPGLRMLPAAGAVLAP